MLISGWQLSGFFQLQSGTPYTIFSPDSEILNAPQMTELERFGTKVGPRGMQIRGKLKF